MEICFKETELCLGLPGVGGTGGGGGGTATVIEGEVVVQKSTGKRVFVDLELNLKSEDRSTAVADLNETVKKSNLISSSPKERNVVVSSATAKDPAKPPAKAQVVGWPPVRSYRKNLMAPQKVSMAEEAENKGSGSSTAFVKVSMDGAPYLRKVDLKTHGSYQELLDALVKMFSSFTMGNYGAQGMIDFMNESKLMDLLNSFEYVPTYEDKDGDWMLVGDVPWEMFMDSCKRLRIMKGSEAIGLGKNKKKNYFVNFSS